MVLCMHTNTSSAAGYRGALEGWAKAGIKTVELNALFVDEFLKTDTLDGARKVLTDNGLTPVTVRSAWTGCSSRICTRRSARGSQAALEMFASLGLTKIYTTSGGTRKLTLDDYKIVVDNMRRVGEIAKPFNMIGQRGIRARLDYTCRRCSPRSSSRARPRIPISAPCSISITSGRASINSRTWIRSARAKFSTFTSRMCPTCRASCSTTPLRIIPGDGVSPLNAMLRKLAEKGYAGPLSVELFLPRFQQGDPYEIATRNSPEVRSGDERGRGHMTTSLPRRGHQPCSCAA